MLVNALKMRPDVKSVHMGCMACAAGALGINLLQDLLKVTQFPLEFLCFPVSMFFAQGHSAGWQWQLRGSGLT
jgi:hypothetical protein